MTLEEIKEHLESQFHLPGEQVEAMLPGFIDALSSHLENLDHASEVADFALIGKGGHKIKGACLNLGIQKGAEIALEIEQKGKAGDSTADFKALVNKLHIEIDPLLK